MSRIDSQQGLTPSLLDRLIDPDSEGSGGRRGYSLGQMVDAVRRDLEDLLNTHRSGAVLPDAFVEVKNSVYNYGLPDLVSFSATMPKVKEQIGKSIEEVIRRFEPRLRDVRAIILEADEGKILSTKFQVAAKFSVEPFSEVEFVTIVKLTTGQASVESGGE